MSQRVRKKRLYRNRSFVFIFWKLCFYILEVQVEKGNPYILFKDTCNKKSNQQNLEPIKSSNLCTDIIEYSSPRYYCFKLAFCCMGWLQHHIVHSVQSPAILYCEFSTVCLGQVFVPWLHAKKNT